MNRWPLLLFLYFIAPAHPAHLHAQASATANNRYDGQITAIEQMLDKGRYPLALTQAESLAEMGRQQRLSDVEAYGNYLIGRALIEDPSSASSERVRGVRFLRRASRGFTNEDMTATVDSIAGQLRDLSNTDGAIATLPGVRDIRTQNQLTEELGADELDNTTLGAIVALQNQAIEALNDSQLRQLVLLQKKDLEIDSFEFQLVNDSLLLMRQEAELEEQRALTQAERQRRNFFIVLALGVLVALSLLYLRYRSGKKYQQVLREKNGIIEKEQRRSDELLLNILPLMVAEELKENGKATARRYESASVLFSDFVGFSRIASAKEPEVLVGMLDKTFRAFDEITARHGLEKIKTIGDAYMCVGGIPTADPDHANKTVRAALELQQYLKAEGVFRARIGIHSGPVVAGVVGQMKFAYDIWGDTVNQAARLESAGTEGEVVVSEAICALLDASFTCIPDGTFTAKNIGHMNRYIVKERRLTKKPS